MQGNYIGCADYPDEQLPYFLRNNALRNRIQINFVRICSYNADNIDITQIHS